MFLVGERIETRKYAETTLYTLPKNKSKKLEKKSKKGVDIGKKCGIINKLSRKTAALQKSNKSDAPSKNAAGDRIASWWKAFGRLQEAQKNIEKSA